MKVYNKILPVFILFILITVIVLIFKATLLERGFAISTLLVGNLLLFCLSFLGFFLQIRGLKSKNINAFLRGIYASLLVKIFIVIIVLGIYLFVTKGKVNKPALFTIMGLYILYTFIEVKQLLKISRKKPDA